MKYERVKKEGNETVKKGGTRMPRDDFKCIRS